MLRILCVVSECNIRISSTSDFPNQSLAIDSKGVSTVQTHEYQVNLSLEISKECGLGVISRRLIFLIVSRISHNYWAFVVGKEIEPGNT